MRIHTRPARFMWRVMARRAASIWRALSRSGSIALRPNWPKLSVAPLVATPLIRPLCALRNLVRLRCSMALRLSYDLLRSLDASTFAARAARVAFGHAPVLRHRIVLEDFAFEYPHLDAAGSVGRERGCDSVIDVGAQGMQRHPAFPIPFQAGDFGAAEPARAVDTDTFGAEPHRRLHGALHGATERDATLELLGDRFSNKLGVQLRLANLDDIDDHIAVGELRHFLAQLLDVGTLLADDDTGPR